MPQDNTVQITVDMSDPAQPVVACQPNRLHVVRDDVGAVPLTFQCLTAGWQFPSEAPGPGHMYGISIQGNHGDQFANPTRSDDGLQVVIEDDDDNNTTYAYTVQLIESSTGRRVGVDPKIINDGGG